MTAGGDTACAIRDRAAPPPAPLPPATSAACDCLAWCRVQFLPSARTFFSWNWSQVAGHLLAARETTDVAQGQHESQRGVWAHSRLRHQKLRLRVLFGCMLHRSIQFSDLLVQHGEQSE